MQTTAEPEGSGWQSALRIFMRISGTVMCVALVPTFMPLSWMAAIHEALKLGKFPEGRIVEYLARSLSAFYAIHGGLFWLVSTDLRRFAPILTYLICVMLGGGVALLALDLVAGMPLFWTLSEGPFVFVAGLLLAGLKTKALGGKGL